MKQIIGHRITLVFTTIALILSLYWYFTSWEIEPLIGIITSAGILIIGIFFTANQAEPATPENQSEVPPATSINKQSINNKGAKIGQQNIGSTVTNKNTNFFPKK